MQSSSWPHYFITLRSKYSSQYLAFKCLLLISVPLFQQACKTHLTPFQAKRLSYGM